MKKHSLFKFMSIIILLVVILTYFLAGRTGEVTGLPFGDVLTNYIQSYYYFFDTVIFMLTIGAFYGVLNNIDAYKKLLDNMAKKIKPSSKKFIYFVIVLFAVISALTGMTLPLIVFIPFVVSIILLLGYDKLVAISSTVVSTLIGFIGGIFVTFRDPNGYGYSAITFDEFVGIDKFTNTLPQLLLLVLGIALLIVFVNKHIKAVEKKKVKYELNDNNNISITEVKGEYNGVKTWPLIVILSLLFILLVLGLIPWDSLFGIDVFTKFHTLVGELSIKEFTIFSGVISTTFPAFGQWASLGSYMMIIIVMLLVILIIKLIYRVKLDDLLSNMYDGAKKLLPTASLMMLAYCVLVCSYNNGFLENIISKVSTGGNINFVVASLITMVGSLLHVDIYYTAAGVFTPILNVVADEALFDVFALAFQSLYGFINIIGPTSLILIFALSYLDVPYTTWVKHIWRFVLSLFIIIFATLLIIALI